MATDAAQDAVIRRRVVRSTASNYLGKAVTLSTWFVLTPFLLHQLGATGYGLWVLAGSLVTYGKLLDLGIGNAVVKYVAEHRARGDVELTHSLIATTLRLYSALGLVAAVLCASIAPVFPDLFGVPPEQRLTATWLVLLLGLTVGISIPCTTATAVLRGLQRYDLFNLVTTVGTLCTAAATVVVLLLDFGVLGMVAVNIPVNLAMQAASIWFINRVAPELRFGWRGASREHVRTILSFSWSLFLVDVAGRLQERTNELVIGFFLPLSSVAPFAIAQRLSELPQILTDQFMKVLLPLASELHAQDDPARLRFLYLAATRLTVAIFVPFACTLIILAPSILTLWVGAAYAEYAYLVTILAVASLIVTSQWPAHAILQGMARHRPLAAMSLGSGVASVVLSIVLVQHFALTGVACATLIAFLVECLGFSLPYAMRVMGVTAVEIVGEVFLPALAPAAPMAVALYAARHILEPSSLVAVALIAAIGFPVYAAGYLVMTPSRVERHLCGTVALNTLRLTMRLRTARS